MNRPIFYGYRRGKPGNIVEFHSNGDTGGEWRNGENLEVTKCDFKLRIICGHNL